MYLIICCSSLAVSTDFTDQIHSLSAQRAYFTEYISGNDEWEMVEVYYDEGITGTSTKKRDGFNRMIADCEKGMIDTILTKEVSKLSKRPLRRYSSYQTAKPTTPSFIDP